MGLKNLAKLVKKEQSKADEPYNLRFLTEIEDYMVKSRVEGREAKGESRLAFRPSSYYHCARQLWYWLNRFPYADKPTAVSERWTEIGTITHRWIQDEVLMPMSNDSRYKISLVSKEELSVYGQDGVEFITEHDSSPIECKFLDHRWTKKIPISAMTDGLLNYLGQDFIYEFKTAKQEKFEPLIYPMKHHIMQGALYSLCLGLPVMFHYINKNTQQWKSFFIQYTPEQLDWVVRRLNTVEDYYITGTLPPKEEDEEGCRYCPYHKYCSKDIDKKD